MYFQCITENMTIQVDIKKKINVLIFLYFEFP